MISRRFGIQVGLVSLALLGTALPASAQIYTWRNADGQLILSNLKPERGTSSVQSYSVPRADDVRATRAVTSDRARAYDDIIIENARQHGVRASLVRAVIQVESAFNPHAVSEKGAMGLMQLMPATAREFGVRNAFDPTQNVGAGVAYLKRLLERYDNNEELALAAYNAGPGAVDKYGQSIPPYRETKNYVVKVNGLAERKATRNTELFKSIEIVDGRAVIKYTDKKPDSRQAPVPSRQSTDD